MELPAPLREALADDRLFDLEAAEAAELIHDLLAVELEAEAMADRDSAAVGCLSGHPESRTILKTVSLNQLVELARRIADHLDEAPCDAAITDAWGLLDAVRHREIRRRIADAGTTNEWADLITLLVERSDFTFARLFKQRADRHPSRVLFIVPGHGEPRRVTWRQVQGRVDLLARGLLASTDTDEPGATMAILSDNRLDMVLLDLACLTSGIVNIMIPATATETDVEFILNHASVGTVAVAGHSRMQMILGLRDRCATLKRIITLDGGGADPRREILPLEAILERAGNTSLADLTARRNALRIGDRATVMYTSGTTGVPKGICFTHRNIVSKRFHRALALPEIGEGDCFLSYLPLFHTFGRFLEMTGSIFWGASYVFAENPAIDTLMRQMVEHQPTIFISIPMKWIQLYEAVAASVPLETADEDLIRQTVSNLTGGRLSCGLSAAGYLDPDIFRFFQRNGVELMSGFGMTEATGGITMTPPGRYREDSLGPALPGIELGLANDGELLVRGPYVMEGYLDPPDDVESFDNEGWFHTGDLMEMSGDGFITIIDRKKEIYKNVKGQTVAPQKIENLFRDFDSVGRVFLVGDHRPYNTALIQPELDLPEADLRSLSADELKNHYRSIVVTANTFLAPYERIVDFAVIDREFSAEHGELTPKNTFRRKTVERNFAEVIRQLYQRATVRIGEVDLVFPNWLFQALGVTAQNLDVSEGTLRLAGTTTELDVVDLGNAIQVGRVVYRRNGDRPLNLGSLLSAPRLWLGNEQLYDFVPLEADQREYKSRRRIPLVWERRVSPFEATDDDRATVDALIRSPEPDMLALHHAALMLESARTQDASAAVRALEHVLDTCEGSLAIEARRVLRRAAMHRAEGVIRRSFQVLAIAERSPGYRTMLRAFLDALPDLLDSETTGVLVERSLTQEQLEAVFAETDQLGRSPSSTGNEITSARGLLRFLAEYGANHPASYRSIRAFVTRVALTARDDTLRKTARTELDTLRLGFRTWLGAQTRIAVDTETGFEYHWEDVVAFADDVDSEAKERIMAALRSTPMLREGVFLFAGGVTIGLSDILPGGVWIRLLGEDHGKSVYRLAVKTRTREQFDLALNLNRDLERSRIEEEIDWLVVCCAGGDKGPLVEEFGGWWPDHGLWTEEFIGGDTLDHALKRLARRSENTQRLIAVWPHAAWSALAAYVDFWDRTGRRFEVADPTPANVVVPMHDYHTDARLVSIAARQPFSSMTSMLDSFWLNFIATIEALHPELAGLVTWDIPCAALLEIVGESEGVALLEQALASSTRPANADFEPCVTGFLRSVRERGFLPRRLFFAAKRYRRWARLNPDATTLARASTLAEIDSTYGLNKLQGSYPEARARFFRETVFRSGPASLVEGLDDLITRLRKGALEPDELSSAIADLRAHLTLDHDEDYFLARLSYPYLQPEDEAAYVDATTAGSQQSEMVVTVEDDEGETYRIRHALSPKEVGRLHRLFLAANLQVQFRPEHRFLVAVNDRGHLMGGLFYEISPEARTAHMDKVVVGSSYRGRGIAGHLLDELCNRMKTGGLVSVTTGFFRPQFFYRYGFTVERRYAGLVRHLTEDEPNVER